MGGREHSVVVDSESWTKTTERNSDSHLYRHITEDSERKTTGGTWCAGMRQSDAELSALWKSSYFTLLEDFPELRVTPHIILKSIPDPSSTLTFLLKLALIYVVKHGCKLNASGRCY